MNSRLFANPGDYIEIPKSDKLKLKNGWTICFWAKLTTGNTAVITKGSGPDILTSGIFLFSTYDGNMYVSDKGTNYILTFPVSAYLGSWHCFCISDDGVASKAFVDGVLVKTGAPSTQFFDIDAPIRIGQAANSFYSYQNSFQGNLAHLQIFGRPLSMFEMSRAMNKPGINQDGLLLWLKMNTGDPLVETDYSQEANDAGAAGCTPDADGPSIPNYNSLKNLTFRVATALPVIRKDLYVNDIGIVLQVVMMDGDSPQDISAAQIKQIRIKRPDRTLVALDATFATDGTDGIIQVVTRVGLLTMDGAYTIQGAVSNGSLWWYSSQIPVTVKPKLELV